MNPSLPTCSRRSRRRRRKRGGEGGSPPPTPPQQHQNPHAGASTPALLMRPQDHHHHPPRQHQQHSALRNIERLERIDRAVAKAWPDLVAAGESVSSWKVSQAVVLALQVDSWSSMGFSMQQINAFIPCSVETQKITSLYDMQKAVCKNGGIEQFEELELGPFLRYPLVMHYFSPNSDVTEVFEITGEFLFKRKSGKRKSRKPIEIGDLLSFISKEKSVSGMEKLGVRIRNLGLQITCIKCGMLEDVYDAIDKQMADGITLPTLLPESKDTHLTSESATDNARHSAEPTKSIISKHASLSHLSRISSYIHNVVYSQTIV